MHMLLASDVFTCVLIDRQAGGQAHQTHIMSQTCCQVWVPTCMHSIRHGASLVFTSVCRSKSHMPSFKLYRHFMCFLLQFFLHWDHTQTKLEVAIMHKALLQHMPTAGIDRTTALVIRALVQLGQGKAANEEA